MKLNSSIRNILFIWVGWALVMLLFQHWLGMRVTLKRPDNVLGWTGSETTTHSQSDKPYLIEPLLNEHVSWDSEYYLGIAIGGYDDPAIQAIPADFNWGTMSDRFCSVDQEANCISLSYAFFPLYPLVTRIVAIPLGLFSLSTIARYTLAAVLVSLLGTLGAMLSLYSMTRSSLGDEGGVRAAFYLLIFPSGFFLAQVYTEGLFIGLTFGSLAFLMTRKRYLSALLAALAVWARPGGAILFIPLAMVWFIDKTWQKGWKVALGRGLAVLSPLISYGIWSLTSMADKFHLVEESFFGRGFFALGPSAAAWGQAVQSLFQNNLQTKFYYGLEFAVTLLAVLACILLLKDCPELSLFGLLMIVFAFTSGSAQGMVRYVLVVPALFWMLARWGRNSAFDRVWSLLSILLMGLEVLLFSFDFWVA